MYATIYAIKNSPGGGLKPPEREIMKLVSLINFYLYTFDAIDVYDYQSKEFMYTAEKPADVGLDTYVKRFSVYETDEKTILEIYI